MKTTTISEICLVNPRMPTSLASQKDRDVDFVPMANVGEDGRITVNGPRKLHEVQKGYTYFQNGDVIVAKITPCMENGKAAYVRNLPNEVAFGSTEFHVLRPQDGLDPAYLFHMIWSPFFRLEAGRNMTGTAGQQRVPTSFFERFKIPLPSLPEQRRIADILDKADGIRRKRREGLNVEELIKSIFNEMFGNPLEGSTSEVTHFGEVVNRITYGFTCPMDHVEAGIPIITGKNVRDGFIDYDNVHYARQDQYDALTAKSKPQCGDLLIIKDGAIRGRCAIFDKPFPICINQSVCLVQPNRDRVTSEFLYGYLTSTVVRRKIDAMDKGVAMPHLQITELAKFPLKLPSLRHQEDFGERYRQTLRLGNQLTAATCQVNDLFNSLIQRAFRGEL